MSKPKFSSYAESILGRKRLKTREVRVGNVGVGGDNPIRIQSMTTTDTMDTVGSVEQSIRLINAGCEIVRLTAPSKKDAENLQHIKSELVKRGYDSPLVADIHFTPNAAEIAAKIVEKVRVNPGNYADKKRFENIDYSDESYELELKRIEEKFTPLVLLCKERGTSMRIGTNHGSLSDRILSRYGDTPQGMVESAMEFLRICVKLDYHEIVLSMKASNTLVMVQAYRLLVATMRNEGMNYPLHLGVTEAGDGEDGRIKSAVGIGSLLEDGIGDTIRVSLTEEPEAEIPVAKKLIDKYINVETTETDSIHNLTYDPYSYQREQTQEILDIGGNEVPKVIADLSALDQIKPSHLFGHGYSYSVPLDKWHISDQACDYIYIGQNDLTFDLPGTLKVIYDENTRHKHLKTKRGHISLTENLHETDKKGFIRVNEYTNFSKLKSHPHSVLLLESNDKKSTHYYRSIRLKLAINNINNPVVLRYSYSGNDPETFQLWAASITGSQLIDGFGDAIWLTSPHGSQLNNSTSFGILQATRTRISKTEYISCPSCGRTLFDLQETTAKIRSKTSHLKGVKIGIMGCIVNGPGEMADADYGYVGTRPGKIHLYKEQEVVRKNVDEDEAVDALINLIKEHGDWVEPC